MPQPIVRRAGAASILAALFALAATLPAAATTFTWNDAGGGNWSTAAKWTPNGIPGAGDVAVLPTLSGSYQVTLDTNPAVNQLQLAGGATLDLGTQTLAGIGEVDNAGTVLNYRGVLASSQFHNQSGGLVSCAANDSILMSGIVQNDGVIHIGPDAGSALFLTDSTRVQGNGALEFVGNARANSALPRPQFVRWLRTDSGQTIRGAGDFWVPVDNGGTVTMDHSLGALMTFHQRLNNRGTMQVGNLATINVDGPVFTSYGGQVIGTNGTFSLQMPGGENNQGTIDMLGGGTLVAKDGDLTVRAGMIAEGAVARVDSGAVIINYAADWQNPVIQSGAELKVTGLLSLQVNGSTVQNHGQITVQGYCDIDGDSSNVVNLAGDGQMVLQGGTLESPVGGQVINQAGHTITGCGTVSANITNYGTIDVNCSGMMDVSGRVVNNGTMRVTKGFLNFRGTRLRNGGTIDGATGTLQFMTGMTLWNTGTIQSGNYSVALGSQPFAIQGGTLSGSGGFRNVGNTTLNGVTLASGSSLTTIPYATTTATGTSFVLHGTNVIQNGGTFTLSPTTGLVESGGATVLQGGRLNAPLGYQVNGSLSGTGTVAANVTNAGHVTPDVSASGLTIQGDYQQTSAAQLAIGIAGTSPGSYAQLNVTGAASLDGLMAISQQSGYTSAPAQTFQVMAVGSRSGQFAQVQSDLPLAVTPLYVGNDVKVQTDALLAVGDPSLPKMLRFAPTRGGFVLEMPQAGTVTVRAFDVAGRQIAVLADGPLAAGVHAFKLDGRGVASGLYFARATVMGADGNHTLNARAVMVR